MFDHCIHHIAIICAYLSHTQQMSEHLYISIWIYLDNDWANSLSIIWTGPARIMSTMTFYPCYLLCVCLGILCVVFVSYWNAVWRGGFAWDGSGKQFNWHPVLMVTGLVALYGNGEWNEIKSHCFTLPQDSLSLPLTTLFISHVFCWGLADHD